MKISRTFALRIIFPTAYLTSMKRFAALFAAVVSLSLSSCLTVIPTPGGPLDPNPQPGPGPGPGPGPNPDAGPPSRPEPIPIPTPSTGWHLSSHRNGYDLDVIVNGQEYHVDNGGEHFDPHPISTRSEGVGPGALSAYEVHGPDGEDTIYWIEQNGATLLVYSRHFDPYSGRWGRERRLRTIRL